MKVDNAIIMAAGTSSRFAPLSFYKPKALIEVKGEVLIERQIRQLREAGIKEVVIVTGFKADSFRYLEEKYGVVLVNNPEYLSRNNNSSIFAARRYLKNSYVCSADNYFLENPFEASVDESYYAAVYSEGKTGEWCLTTDGDGYISSVEVGGTASWYMLGHTFWSRSFSRKFLEILEADYGKPEIGNLLWEAIYMQHLDVLKMRMRKYPSNFIFEFDTLDELRTFDESYKENTRSVILESIAEKLGITVGRMHHFSSIKDVDNAAVGFTFDADDRKYSYRYSVNELVCEN